MKKNWRCERTLPRGRRTSGYSVAVECTLAERLILRMPGPSPAPPPWPSPATHPRYP